MRIAIFGLLVAANLLTPPILAEGSRPLPPVAAPHERLLPLQGGQNFRDLGGYQTSDGRTVRWGLLYRSGSMHWLTAADHAYLEKLGIRTVCDFRDSSERTSEPATWPADHAPTVFADDYRLDMGGIGLGAPGEPLTAEKARQMMASLYPRLLARLNGQYRRMFGELLAGRAPLAFNCTAGKDRTGIAAALILTALGVPRETVVQDYLLTNRYFDPTKVVRKDGKGSDQWKAFSPEVLKALMGVDRSYIEAVFAVMDSHPDGVKGYLRDELGLSGADIAKLRRYYTA
jgi:protein-tyrosine phosphatase